ncbi:hypothetical protein ACHAXA_004572 [Cyclostephanos tholiformis]|uniref:Spp2/MOS2 G-patch domain-containing protein n=1 Tax=Cyclostephanos tholiformis TaxID=382380 RepID=A0ABD3RKJ7_9STRA
MDGRPPLSGFSLGRRAASDGSSVVDARPGTDAPRRWRGPLPPVGYVLKRHVFDVADVAAAAGDAFRAKATKDGADCGLGLILQRRREERQPRSFVPRVLPSVDDERREQKQSGKLLARDGTELNFHAVRESMKNRFVASSTEIANATDPVAPPRTVVAVDDDDHTSKRDPDEEEFVSVFETVWVPTRLLCKRWNVPVPSTVGMSAAMDVGSVSERGRRQGKEEDYFRQTVYEPAVAGRRKDVGGERGLSTSNITSDGGVMPVALDDESDSVGPPPTRPTVEVLRSIFDAESDMDISSSDEDESDVGVANMVGRDESGVAKTKEEGGKVGATSKQNGDITNVDNFCPPDPIDSSSSCDFSSSNSSRSTMRGHNRHRRHRRRSRGDGGYDKERKIRERRHGRSDKDETRGYHSNDMRKRTKKKKKKKTHRSHGKS